MSKIEVDTIEPQSGTTVTLGASGDTITVPSGVSLQSPGLTLSDNIVFDTANKGIYLGVTSATASNLLDDYEEGTFTPTILGDTTAGTGTYAVQSGAYTKIGNTVTVAGKIVWTAHTGTGNMKLGGLPFTTNGFANHQSCLTMGEIGNITTAANNILTAHTIQNTTQAFFGRTPVGGGGDGAITLDTDGYFRFSTTYQTS